MEKSNRLPRFIQFGEFRFDTQVGELRKGELVLRVPQQPLQILCFLLEHPGELVSREELRTLLWPDGTFLDFEDGINHAVRRLRDALGDTSEHPRFIETVPRRGYRFLAPVKALALEVSPVGSESPDELGLEPAASMTAGPVGTVTDAIGDRRKETAFTERRYSWRRLAIALAGALVLVGSVLAYWLTRPLPPPRILRTVQLTNNGRGKGGRLVTDGARLYF